MKNWQGSTDEILATKNEDIKILNIKTGEGEVVETTCAVSEQESPKKVKKLKVEKQDSAERPKVEVDFKNDMEVAHVSLEKLKHRKKSLKKNPIFNRDLDNGPELYGQHFDI
jgi:hypothetical protein